jgi:hypothetical protein
MLGNGTLGGIEVSIFIWVILVTTNVAVAVAIVAASRRLFAKGFALVVVIIVIAASFGRRSYPSSHGGSKV